MTRPRVTLKIRQVISIKNISVVKATIDNLICLDSFGSCEVVFSIVQSAISNRALNKMAS
jgi:hypothetical protein